VNPTPILRGALGVLLLAVPARAADRVATLPLAEVQPGQRAVVRTVFAGARVDTFAAEIVGVLHMGRAGGDMILARATSERVLRTGVAQGMSGSPIYVDGKLVGALSAGFPFARDAVFGATPIGEMLDVLDLPEHPAGGATQGPAGIEGSTAGLSGEARSSWGEFRWPQAGQDEGEDRTSAGAGPAALRSLALPLVCVGLQPGALEAARPLFERLGLSAVPGGAAPRGGPPADSLVPGAAVAVDLLRGDHELAAIGTVTWRDGDRLLAFGHPLFQSGAVSLPIATAEIAAIVASENISFKMGMPGRVVGTLLEDRRAAVAGRIGSTPRMLPFTVAVTGARPKPQRFRFESIADRLLAPQLVGAAALNSLLESAGQGANQTVSWSLRLHARGRPPLALADRVVSDAAAGEVLSQLAQPLTFLLNNPFERLELDSLAVELEVHPGRDQWTLRNVRLDRAAVRPGGEVVLRCEVERLRGVTEERELRLRVPPGTDPGEVTLWVGGADELTRYEARRLPARYRPSSLDEAWRRLAALRASDGLYAVLIVRQPDVTADGADLPGLPSSAQAVLLSPQQRGDDAQGGRVALVAETKQRIGGVVQGELMLPLTVDPQAP
jgi:hypothetical protein